jgi:hypothetical protein
MKGCAWWSRGGERGRAGLPVPVILLLVSLVVMGVAVSRDARAQTPAPKPSTASAAQAAADSMRAEPDSAALSHRVIAYYLHTTKRCVSCRKIESFTQEAMTTGFPGELKSGRLVWRVVNVEEKGNEHFVKEFQLFTKSVVLVDERDGKQHSWKNLAKVWEYLNDRTRFIRYVQEETRAFVAAAQP